MTFLERLGCPTPTKRSFLDEGMALALIAYNEKRFHGRVRAQRPYRCTCGLWHISTLSRSRARRRALKKVVRGQEVESY